MKYILIKVIYTFVWSLGLLVVTFKDFWNKDFTPLVYLDTYKEQIGYPLLTSMILFIIDVVFNLAIEGKNADRRIISCMMIFLCGMLGTMIFNDKIYIEISFYVIWIALTFMKFFSMLPYSKTQINIINNNER